MSSFDNSSVKVLVIDDDTTILKLVNDILSREGYAVHQAETGQEGLTKAADIRPDIIIMDITMPGMSGYQVTEQLKTDPALADIPIIFLSGRSPDEDGGRAFAKGGVTYIRKPFTVEQICSMVKLTLQSVAG